MAMAGYERCPIHWFKTFKESQKMANASWSKEELADMCYWVEHYIEKGVYNAFASAATRMPGRASPNIQMKYKYNIANLEACNLYILGNGQRKKMPNY